MNPYQQYPWQFDLSERPMPSLRKPTPHFGPAQVFLLLLTTALLTVGVVLGTQRAIDYFQGPPAMDAQARAVTPRGDLASDEKTTIDLYNRSKMSVVHITTTVARRDVNYHVSQVPEGTGSGFIWDDQGHVVTNYHVIRSAQGVNVMLSDRSTYPARLIGSFPDHDLAVLQIDAPKSKLRPIPVGNSDELQVGQKAFAIGNPFGLDQTLTTGIVSALNREIESVTHRSLKGVIQTDAAINPGNSGGPLLDSASRLIGVNTAIYSPSGSSSGIGFAIPVNEVNRIVPQLIRAGSARPGNAWEASE